MIAATAMFCWAGYQLLDYYSENKLADQDNQKLIDQAVTIKETVDEQPPQPTADTEDDTLISPQTEPPAESEHEEAPISVDFTVLQQTNPDIIAWIHCPDTTINYPVAQADDNQYYLRRLTDGTYNTAGTIFVDFRNASDMSDRNTLIYGHNMKNGSMFHSLSGYRKQDYYEQHPVIWLLTPEKTFRINLISGFVTRADSDSYTFFETDEDLLSYLEQAIGKSTFSADTDISQISRIVTLSTCTHEGVDKRYILIGALEELVHE